MNVMVVGIEDVQAYLPSAVTAGDAILASESPFRHARYYGSAVRLAASIARKLAERKPIDSRRTGLLCNGGPWNLGPAKEFAERARSSGAAGLNPLAFPATLVSATATAAAAVAGIHAFSYVIGHDKFAFAEVLRAAIQSLRHGHAERVLAIAVCAPPDPAMQSIAVRTGRTSLGTVAIGFSLVAAQAASAIAKLQLEFDAASELRPAIRISETGGPLKIDERADDSLSHGTYDFLGATLAVRLISALHHTSVEKEISVSLSSGTSRATLTLAGADPIRSCLSGV